MQKPLSFAIVLSSALVFTHAATAAAADTECPVSQFGQACGGGSTCIPATCCDDPNGCAYDAGPNAGGSSSGSGGAGSSSSGVGPAPTGVSRVCGVCTLLGEPYCSPADEGKACGDGGVCGGFGGGGENLPELDGGTTYASYEFLGCQASSDDSDGGQSGSSSGSGSGSSSGSSGGGSGSGGSGGGGSSSSGSSGGGGSSSSGSSSGSSGGGGSSGSSGGGSGSSGSGSTGGGAASSGGTASDAGTGGGTVTSGCTVAPGPTRSTPWGLVPWIALGVAAVTRRRRYFA